MSGFRGTLIRIITFLGGLYFLIDFFFPEILKIANLKERETDILNGFTALGAIAFGLGLINLVQIHGSKLIYLRKRWIHSFALLLGVLLMAAATSFDWYEGSRSSVAQDRFQVLSLFAKHIQEADEANRTDVPPFKTRVNALVSSGRETLDDVKDSPENASKEDAVVYLKLREEFSGNLEKLLLSTEKVESSTLLKILETESADLGVAVGKLRRIEYENSFARLFYRYLFDGFLIALGASMFALLAAYIASAAYKAFRVRSFEASLMMIAAIIVILGQTPFGVWITDSLPAVRSWILEVPSTAAFRAIRIGALLAGLILAVRMLLSLDSDQGRKKT